MSVTSGYTKYKRYAKLSDGTYKLVSQWTSSNTVHFDDGNTAQTKVGAINGITDSLTATSSNVALSAAGGNNLQGQIDTLNSNLEWKSSVTTSIQLPDTWREAIIYVSINGEWRNMTLSKIALEDTPFLYSVGEVTGRYFSVQASKSSIALYLVYADSKQVTGSTMVVTYK